MLQIRRAEDRGQSKLSWLDSRFTFSFAEYHDPAHMGFRSLRVINDDRIAPGGGFGMHSHRDMEIITCVLEGALAHKDSLGNGSVIRPGDVQRMSAGTGIQHSEFNQSQSETVHLLQIWILPNQVGLPPSYEQKAIPLPTSQLRLIASPDGRDGSVTIHQDTYLLSANLSDARTRYDLAAGRYAWLHVAEGSLALETETLKEGDAAAFAGPAQVSMRADPYAQVLLFDLA